MFSPSMEALGEPPRLLVLESQEQLAWLVRLHGFHVLNVDLRFCTIEKIVLI